MAPRTSNGSNSHWCLCNQYANLSQPTSPLKRDPHFDKDHFCRTVTHEESHRTFTSPIQTAFPQISPYNLIFLFPSHLFFIRTLQTPPKDKQDFNRFWEASSQVIFLFQRKSLLLEIAPFFLHTETTHPHPKGTCSLNRPWRSSLNRIWASIVIHKEFLVSIDTPFFLELLDYNLLKKLHAIPIAPPPPNLFYPTNTNPGDTWIQSSVTNFLSFKPQSQITTSKIYWFPQTNHKEGLSLLAPTSNC